MSSLETLDVYEKIQLTTWKLFVTWKIRKKKINLPSI